MNADADKRKAFEGLISEVTSCRKCRRMNASERVFGYSCGGMNASVMFIGEAPGRLGADATQIPFHGDQAGHNFENFLLQVGINRYESFVTNAVLCNPRDSRGNNATPTLEEVRNCSAYLRRQMELVQPKVVVTLGTVALRAAALLQPHGLSVSKNVRVAKRWYGRTLIPLYHPGQRAMIHRSFSNQLSDYQAVSEAMRSDERARKHGGKYSPKVAAIVQLILSQKPRLTYFALHKLFYLIEVRARGQLGRRITNSYIIRQKDGPYCVDLHLSKLKGMVPGLGVVLRKGKIELIASATKDLFGDGSRSSAILSESEKQVVASIVSIYGELTDVALKRRSYLTPEMRAILRSERRALANTFNMPLLLPLAGELNL